ncbi:MAG: hypothetical protein REI78_03065 [Pedobacter sp.]|nr:hypothetical protein [Pedobacter sp.]MDQ8051973.1 hypothetical protein [Pedobacter sp.]
MCISITGMARQQVKSYVQQQARPIRTIEPDSLDFSDLKSIGDAIGNSRIVMLGEQDHGDAPTFLAKTRLIKYLHEKKGFDVIAFENDFFTLNQGWDGLPKQKEQIIDFLQHNIFTIWSNCKQCENLLYKYIPQSSIPKIRSRLRALIHRCTGGIAINCLVTSQPF